MRDGHCTYSKSGKQGVILRLPDDKYLGDRTNPATQFSRLWQFSQGLYCLTGQQCAYFVQYTLNMNQSSFSTGQTGCLGHTCTNPGLVQQQGYRQGFSCCMKTHLKSFKDRLDIANQTLIMYTNMYPYITPIPTPFPPPPPLIHTLSHQLASAARCSHLCRCYTNGISGGEL